VRILQPVIFEVSSNFLYIPPEELFNSAQEPYVNTHEPYIFYKRALFIHNRTVYIYKFGVVRDILILQALAGKDKRMPKNFSLGLTNAWEDHSSK